MGFAGDQAVRLVDEYMRTVADALRGPRRARRAAADEVRDHLLEAVERGDVASEGSIVAGTIAGFGSPQELAAELQPALDRRATHRAVLVFVAVTSAVAALWLAIFLTGPPAPWRESTEPLLLTWMDVVGAVAMKVALFAGLAAVGAIWIVPRSVRRRAVGDALIRWVAWSWRLGMRSLTVAVTTIVAYTLGRGFLAPGSLEWSDILFGASLTIVMMLGLGQFASPSVPG